MTEDPIRAKEAAVAAAAKALASAIEAWRNAVNENFPNYDDFEVASEYYAAADDYYYTYQYYGPDLTILEQYGWSSSSLSC